MCSTPCSPAAISSPASSSSRCAVQGIRRALQTSITAFALRERKPEVDLQRRRALRDVRLGMPARLLGVARDDRVGGIGGVLAVDVRAGREDARPGQTVGRDHPAQLVELLVPLPRIAERGDAVS